MDGALYRAVLYCDPARTGAAIEGLEADQKRRQLASALELSVHGRCHSLLKTLVAAGADATPSLEVAVLFRHVESARLLLTLGADPNSGTIAPLLHLTIVSLKAYRILDGVPARYRASIEQRRGFRIATLLLNAGANIDAPDRSGETALVRAVLHENEAAVDFLLRAGARPVAKSPIVRHHIVDAIRNCRVEMVMPLLDAGLDPNLKDGEQDALSAAAQGGCLLLARALIRKRARRAATPSVDQTALVEAAARGHARVVEYLLMAGPGLNSAQYQGARRSALKAGHAQVVSLLDGYFDYADEDNPEKGLTGRPWTNREMERFAGFQKRHPRNRAVPRRLTPGQRFDQAERRRTFREIEGRIRSGSASRADIDAYYADRCGLLRDGLELFEDGALRLKQDKAIRDLNLRIRKLKTEELERCEREHKVTRGKASKAQ